MQMKTTEQRKVNVPLSKPESNLSGKQAQTKLEVDKLRPEGHMWPDEPFFSACRALTIIFYQKAKLRKLLA